LEVAAVFDTEYNKSDNSGPDWSGPMSYGLPSSIQVLIDQSLATGIYSSEEQVLETALHVLMDYHESVEDIRQGMVDYESGLGEPLSEAMSGIRRELNP
jgi:hypothetical protein